MAFSCCRIAEDIKFKNTSDIRTIRLVLRLSFVLFLILVLVFVCMGVGYDFVIGKGITPNDDEYRPGVARSCYPFSSFKKQKKTVFGDVDDMKRET